MDVRIPGAPIDCTYRHVIRALRAVSIHGPGAVLGRETVQRVAHVGAHILVPVLVQRQGAACVLEEQVQQADAELADLGQRVEDGVGDEVAAARLRRQGEALRPPVSGSLLEYLGIFF